MKFIKRGLLILLCATFLASCGTTKGAVQNDTVKNEKTVKADKKSEKEQKKGEKAKEKNKKKTAKSKKAKSGDYLAAINEAVNAGNYEEAYSLLSEETNRNSLGSDDIYKIDAGMINLYAENYEEAIKHLYDVADMYKLQEKYDNADKVELSTLLLDPYSTDYVTYDYEDMYAVIFDALAKLAQKDNPDTADDAFQDLKSIRHMLKKMKVYKEKLLEKIDEASPSDSKAPEAAGVVFSNSALANYLALIYNKYNDHREGENRDYFYKEMKKAYEQESYKGAKIPAAVKKETEDVPNGMARLNVVALMGLMAEKKGVSEEMTTPINAIVNGLSSDPAVKQLGVALDEITSILTGGLSKRNIQYDYTVLEPRDYNAKTCVIKIGDKEVTLDLIENVNDISSACMEKNIEFDKKRSKFRGTTRYIAAAATYVGAMYKTKDISNPLAKKGAVMAAGKALDTALDIIDENDKADIRGTHFFPAEVHAGALEIAPEKYNVTISFFSSPDPSPDTLIKSVTIPDVEIKAGELNLLTVQCQE